MANSRTASIATEFPVRGWLADCQPRFRGELLALARPKSCAAGSVIYQAGASGGDMFGIVSGVVALHCRFTHPDAVLLQLLWPGEWFGTMPTLVEHGGRRFKAIARTDVELLRVPGDDLRALLQRRPAWVAEIAKDAVRWLDLATQGLVDLMLSDASARCAAVLLRLAGQRWASMTYADRATEIPVSQVEVAMLCNVSRKTLSRVLKEFARRRLVTIGYRSMTVNDPPLLRVIADGG